MQELFTVTPVCAAATVPVTVDYSTPTGTAVAGSDYIKIPPTLLTFAPEARPSRPYSVSVIGDTLLEDDETFSVNLYE